MFMVVSVSTQTAPYPRFMSSHNGELNADDYEEHNWVITDFVTNGTSPVSGTKILVYRDVDSSIGHLRIGAKYLAQVCLLSVAWWASLTWESSGCRAAL